MPPAKNTQPDPAQDTMLVRLLRGYWPKSGGGKIPAGETAELPRDEASALLRMKPPLAEIDLDKLMSGGYGRSA